MGQTVFQIDAFTDRPFAGNPAAVCLLAGPAGDDWMRAVAAEMNLSETAFLVPGPDGYGLRWFTPLVETDLCGHATLASAHFLWEQGHLQPEQEANFRTMSGLLTCRRDGGWIEMDFPATPVVAVEPPVELLEGLRVKPLSIGRSPIGDYLVEVESEAVVRGLRPNLDALARIPDSGVRGVMITARAHTAGYDFVSRFFAPAAGIAEDPVTGSAHCTLAPFWQPRLGKSDMVAYQASTRGGVVRVKAAGDRVLLGGQAVTVMKAELFA